MEALCEALGLSYTQSAWLKPDQLLCFFNIEGIATFQRLSFMSHLGWGRHKATVLSLSQAATVSYNG